MYDDEYVLKTQGLTKRFGRVEAVKDLDLSIKKGSVYGILGPNGSGKTTTLGMVLGVLTPTSGSFSWFQQGDSHTLRRRVGALLEKPNFYPHLNAEKNLRIAALIKESPVGRIEQVLRRVNLYERRRDKFKNYSLGMKQRLALASALLGSPEVLVLDEPTNGLDPQGISDIRQLILEISGEGRTIILASHLLDEVQKVCTDFAVLQKGVLIHQGPVDETERREETRVELAAVQMARLPQLLQAHPAFVGVTSEREHLLLRLKGDVSREEFGGWLFEQGVRVTHLRFVQKNLEDKFFEIVEAAHV